MHNNDRITLTIHTCDKFSDIWVPSLKLLTTNWTDSEMRKMLITDNETTFCFPNIEVVCAGDKKGMPDRARKMINSITTDYLFFTLDDYFLVDKVDNDSIYHLISIMDQFNIDYLSVGNRHKKGALIEEKYSLYYLDLSENDNYIVNLYPAIWRKSFFERTLEGPKDIWKYEVSLTDVARAENAVCCTCDKALFPFIDGIRKGKFLHKAHRYLLNNQLYSGNREVIKYTEEFKLNFIYFLKTIIPKPMREQIKKVLRKKGFQFYS